MVQSGHQGDAAPLYKYDVVLRNGHGLFNLTFLTVLTHPAVRTVTVIRSCCVEASSSIFTSDPCTVVCFQH